MTQRILVTGSTGYIGSHLSQALRTQSNVTLYGLNRSPDVCLPNHQQHCASLLKTNLNGWLDEIQPHTIFHCIGASPQSPFAEQLQLHAEGTRRLLEAATRLAHPPRVVLIGSAAEYGLRANPVDEDTLCQPQGEYGVAKLAQTHLAQSFARRFDLPVIIGRVFNVYGQTPPHLAVASLAWQIAQAELQPKQPNILRVFNLLSQRDFIHVKDVVQALLALSALTQDEHWQGEVFNVASGQPTELQMVLDRLLALSPQFSQARDLQVMRQGPQTVDTSWADIGKIQRLTGWQPTIDLDTGLEEELAFWRAQGQAPADLLRAARP